MTEHQINENERVAALEAMISTQLQKAERLLARRAKAKQRRDAQRLQRTEERRSQLLEETLQEDSPAGRIAREALAKGSTVTVDYERNLARGTKRFLRQF